MTTAFKKDSCLAARDRRGENNYVSDDCCMEESKPDQGHFQVEGQRSRKEEHSNITCTVLKEALLLSTQERPWADDGMIRVCWSMRDTITSVQTSFAAGLGNHGGDGFFCHVSFHFSLLGNNFCLAGCITLHDLGTPFEAIQYSGCYQLGPLSQGGLCWNFVFATSNCGPVLFVLISHMWVQSPQNHV